MSPSRRDVLKMGVGAGAAMLFDRVPAFGQAQAALVRKPIPSSGEQIPVIGLGSSQTFNLTRQSPEYAPALQVLKLFRDLGGKMIDTSPTYQRSEIFLGEALADLGITSDIFIATKVNVRGAGKGAAIAQMEESLLTYGRKSIDLIQVWNLGDTTRALTNSYLADHMAALDDFKKAGKVRYIGVTTSRDPQYADVEKAMIDYKMDFVQLDYSIADREAEARLLPVAKERGIAVIVNRPLTAAGTGRGASGNLFQIVGGRPLPAWAAEFDAKTWAQFFLKFVVSHPSVTSAIPATNDPGHLRDNMGAALGKLPDEAMRKRMADYFASL